MNLLWDAGRKCVDLIGKYRDRFGCALPGWRKAKDWRRRTTNAFLEGLNGVFSAVRRKARGYRSVDNPITMLYFTAARLRLPAH